MRPLCFSTIQNKLLLFSSLFFFFPLHCLFKTKKKFKMTLKLFSIWRFPPFEWFQIIGVTLGTLFHVDIGLNYSKYGNLMARKFN